MTDDGLGPGPPNTKRHETDDDATEDDSRVIIFRDAYNAADAFLGSVMRGETDPFTLNDPESPVAPPPSTAKKAARTIDEDDYGDDDDDEDDDDETERALSPLVQKTSSTPSGNASPWPPKSFMKRGSQAQEITKAPEDARKKIKEDQQAAEEAAQSRFHNLFFTFENDHVAMFEQQRVDELDRQVDAEMSADQRNGAIPVITNGATQGSLSSANLGASSLMLKNLLARIDSKRDMVKAQDWQLRKLISEVRKNRSKWASEDKIGQEELYEAAEKVLSDLKAMTEHSGPFLNRVNKREAPDYYNIIKHPMDIGTMLKKLKGLQYKSKKEFVDDLNLIWANCLQYNTDPNHPLRKKALHLQKYSEQMVFLIPDIVVQDRAEYEAEQRRGHLDAELDGMEDSDDGKITFSKAQTHILNYYYRTHHCFTRS
jgi:transcriptional activator SPT7